MPSELDFYEACARKQKNVPHPNVYVYIYTILRYILPHSLDIPFPSSQLNISSLTDLINFPSTGVENFIHPHPKGHWSRWPTWSWSSCCSHPVPQTRKLMIVRHPFSRLVSAFRDKLEMCRSTTCRGKGGKHKLPSGPLMVKEFRSQALARFGQEFFSKENNYGALYKVKTHRVYELPIFWEFVQWIIHGKGEYNEHWCPNYLYCTPCTANFQYIIKYETMDVETDRLRWVWNNTDINNQWLNRNDGGMPKDDITMEYFKMLDKQDILRLYEIYEPDFRMFNYDVTPFLDQANYRENMNLLPGESRQTRSCLHNNSPTIKIFALVRY